MTNSVSEAILRDRSSNHSPSSSSSESFISVSSSNDEISMHSTISGDSQLDDHRNQNMSLPIRTESKVLNNSSNQDLIQRRLSVLSNKGNAEQPKSASSSRSQFIQRKDKTKRTNSHSSVNSFKRLLPTTEKPSMVNINTNLNSRDLLNKMVVDDEYDEYEVKFNDRYKSGNNISFASNANTPAPIVMTPTTKTRSKSFSEQVKSFIRPKEDSVVGGGILLGNGKNSTNDNNATNTSKNASPETTKKLRPPGENAVAHLVGDSDLESIASSKHLTFPVNNISKVVSHASSRSLRRKTTNDGDSDLDSHASRESQETEEDVCFPMLPEHIRIRGIDFDEIEEFVIQQREENQRIAERERELRMDINHSITTCSEKRSSAALKYIPKGFKYNNNSLNNSYDNNYVQPTNPIRNTNNTSNNITGGKDGVNININNNGTSSSELSEKSHNNNVTNNYTTDAYSLDPQNYNCFYDENKNNNSNSMGNNFGNNYENVTFNPEGNILEEEDELPTRFSFFSSEREETIHAADIPSLVARGQTFKELFEPDDSIWWLDCTCPTDSEMKMLAKAFGIHPLTAEDIRMQETREKVELFKSYYFVSFHTFETDAESEDFLEPINVYIVVFSSGILTFHFSPISNPANVRRRVRQLRDYVNVSADWLCYAMIDDITDGFAPIIKSIEYEADSIEDSVFLSKDNEFGRMLLKIGESRRKVMTLMRLLQGKADVIKMFAKRCQDEAARSNRSSKGDNNNLDGGDNMHVQPRADIALYLGDIQDHIITMFQSLLSYEKIFSRSHSNYLAQLQVESFYANVKVTDMLSKVTILGTILVPMNLITGLFGMNVKVPGNDQTSYGWFGGIIGVMFLIILVSLTIASIYLRRVEKASSGQSLTDGISLRDFRFGRKKKEDDQRAKNDAVSLPTKFTRYGDW